MDEHRKHRWLISGALATTALVAAPYALSALGLGPPDLSDQIMSYCGKEPEGSGLAGLLTRTATGIPGIGQYLGAGTWISLLFSAGFGIGGVVLGNYIHQHFDKPGSIQWGKIIKYAGIATSALIALPSLLSGITMGLTFITFLANSEAGMGLYNFLSSTLGIIGSASSIGPSAGLTSLMPHFLMCGAGALPMVGSLFAPHHEKKPPSHPPSWVARITPPAPAPVAPVR